MNLQEIIINFTLNFLTDIMFKAFLKYYLKLINIKNLWSVILIQKGKSINFLNFFRFTKFLNLLMNDITRCMDEGLEAVLKAK